MRVSLSEVAEVNPKAELPRNLGLHEKYDFLPMADVSETGIVSVTRQRPLSEVQKGFTAFHRGDILIAKITPCFENNKIAIADISTDIGFGSTEFHVVRCDRSRLDNRYLVHLLRSSDVRSEGRKRMTGSAGQQRVPKQFLEELKIPLPPLAEQKRIAAILGQVDDLRRKRQRASDRLSRLGQAIFQEMFGAATDLTLARIKEVARVSTGSTPPTSDEESFGGPVPFITPGDLNSSQPVKRSLSEQGAKRSRTVRAGATLVCCIGATIGKMDRAKELSAFNQQINAIEWGGEIDPVYGFYATQLLRSTIIHKGKGASTTLPILKKSEFEKLEITYPKKELQTLFSSRIAEVEASQSRVDGGSLRLEKLFDTLQASAFKGEL